MDRTRGGDATTGVQAAEIVREYGPYSGAPHVRGVTFDGAHVWFAAGDALRAFIRRVAGPCAAPSACVDVTARGAVSTAKGNRPAAPTSRVRARACGSRRAIGWVLFQTR